MLGSIPLNYYALAGLLNFVTSFILSIFVFFKNPKSPSNQTFSLFAFTVAGWSLFYFLWLSAEKSYLAELYLRTLMLFVIFIPTTFTQFILAFLKVDCDKRINLGNYLISLLIGFTVYTRLFARDIGPFLVFPYWLKPRFLFCIHSIHFFTNVIYSHFLMLQAIKHYSGILRNQVLYVFIGTAIGYSAGAINYLTWYRIPIPPFLNPLVSIYVAFVSYAIIKYQLMGIELAGKYLLVRVLSLVSIGAVIFLGFLPFRETITAHKFIPLEISIILIVSALFFYPLIKRLDRIFGNLLKIRVDYRPALQRYTDTGLTSAYDVKQLSNSMVKTLTDTLKMESCSLMLLDRDKKQYCISASSGPKEPVPELTLEESSALISFLKRKANPEIAIKDELDKILPSEEANLVIKDLEKLKASISLSLFMKDKLMGILNLGPKRSGEVYTPEELTFISTVGKESAIIIQLFKVIEAYQTGRIRTESLKLMAQLLGAIYHEIRNLLVSISSFIQLFRANLYKTKEDLEQALERSSLDIQRAIVVAEAVELYRRDSESKEVKAENISRTIDKALSRAKEELPSAKVEISVDIASDLPQVQGQLTFSDLFFNLIMNSYYAMDVRGGGRLKIKAKRIKDETRPIEVELSDTGGYLSEIMKKGTAFGGEESPERSGVGGINFFLAKLTTNDHAATLEVIDNKEGGTTFVVRLPLVQPQEPEI